MILGWSFYIRVDDLTTLQSRPERFFYADVPILPTPDGYYYLRLSRDLLDGNYDPIDEKRAAPDGRPRPKPVPLLVYLTYAAAKLTAYPLEWIAMIMPAVLGVLLAFPMYGLGKCYGGTAMGLSAALIALCSRHYLKRSSVGWYDTDVLNVSLGMALSFFFLRFAQTQGRPRYHYLLGGVVMFGLLLWWWHTAPSVVVIFAAVPFAGALLFYYRPSRTERMIFYGILGSIALAGVVWKTRWFLASIEDFYAQSFKISSTAFPVVPRGTTELIGAQFEQVVDWSIGSLWGFIAAGLGICLLAWRQRLGLLFIVVPLAVSLLSFEAQRYAIFFAPIVGLGIGAVVHELWRQRHRQWFVGLLAPVFLMTVLWPNIGKIQADNRMTPVTRPYHLEAMEVLAKETPANAVVWADWSYGYPLTFYARRGVVADGGVHSGMHVYVSAVPLVADTFRLAANWMQFYSAHGMDGLSRMHRLFGKDWGQAMKALKEILAAGPEQAKRILLDAEEYSTGGIDRWLRFFFPKERRPVYLFLELTKIRTHWFQYGMWNFETKELKRNSFGSFFGVGAKGGTLTNGKNLVIDVNKGVARAGEQDYSLEELVVAYVAKPPNGLAPRRRIYGRKGGMIFGMIAPTGFGMLMDRQTADTTLMRLFVGLEHDPRYFRPVKLEPPAYQIWEVKGDTIG